MRGKWRAPSSLDEVYEHWGPVALKLAKKWGMGPDEALDFQAQVILEFVAGDYLKIYDPEKGAFSTFWFSFVTKRLRRETSKLQRDPLNHFASLEWESEEGALEERYHPIGVRVVDPQKRLELREALVTVVKALRRYPPEASHRGPNGRFRPRSLLVLFNMLGLGWERGEIARYWRVTEGTVSYMVASLREVPELVEFAQLVEAWSQKVER